MMMTAQLKRPMDEQQALTALVRATAESVSCTPLAEFEQKTFAAANAAGPFINLLMKGKPNRAREIAGDAMMNEVALLAARMVQLYNVCDLSDRGASMWKNSMEANSFMMSGLIWMRQCCVVLVFGALSRIAYALADATLQERLHAEYGDGAMANAIEKMMQAVDAAIASAPDDNARARLGALLAEMLTYVDNERAGEAAP